MVAHTPLLGDLQSIVGAENAFPPKERYWYVVDGLTPSVIALPGSYDEVAAIMRLANERQLAVIPGEPSSLMIVGNDARGYDVALNLARLDRILEHEPADLTVTCQAGIAASELNELLAKNRQIAPFGLQRTRPYGYMSYSVGALVAANYSELRIRYGTPRDFTIGMQVVTPDGRITKAGGKVVKNVAGYDMCKLYAGSRGTLGVIVEATFKLAMLPDEEERIELEFSSPSKSCQFALALFRRGLGIWAISIRHDFPSDTVDWSAVPGSIYVLNLHLAGSTDAVRRWRAEIEALSANVGAKKYRRPEVPDAIAKRGAWEQGAWLECEASVLPTRLPGLIESFVQETPGAHIWHADPIMGTVRAIWLQSAGDPHLLHRVRQATQLFSGLLTVISCSPELKRQIDVFGDVPPKTLDLMRRVKQQFDPNGILSPGRFVGRL